MFADGDDRRVGGHQGVGAKLIEYPLLQVILGQRLLGAHARRGKSESFLHYPVNQAAGGNMRTVLFRAPARFKLLHQIGGANHLAAQRANHLHGSRIHQRDVGDRVAR
jgi:hypothetical protein